MQFLILPQEHDSHLRNTGSTFMTWSLPSTTSPFNNLDNAFSGVTPWTLSAKKDGPDLAKVIEKVDGKAKNDKLGKAELKHFVLSEISIPFGNQGSHCQALQAQW